MARPPVDESGIVVHPKLAVPKARRSEPRLPGSGGGGSKRVLVAGVAIAGLAGGIGGFLAAPSKSRELAKATTDKVAALHAADIEKTRADGLDKALAAIKQDKADAEQKASQLATKAADVDKKAAELADEEKKLQATIDKSQGSVDTEGDEIHLKLVDKVLFAVGDDQLTDRGKVILDKVAIALKDLPEKQVWVQGHTDDQPIFVAPPKKDPKDAKKPPAKPAKPAPPAPAPVRFITNWELSAARALQVVHYLQDVSKLDPTRLAALAFGQYRPVSRTNKALNRRIEIVLYPKREILEKK